MSKVNALLQNYSKPGESRSSEKGVVASTGLAVKATGAVQLQAVSAGEEQHAHAAATLVQADAAAA